MNQILKTIEDMRLDEQDKYQGVIYDLEDTIGK
jgi:hypothetical protein